jgi:hypothetical protein
MTTSALIHRAVLWRGVFLLLLAVSGHTAPSVPCASVTRYATVTDPRMISFAPDGTLYVGRDNSGSGGLANDPVKIRRIGPGGSPVADYGATAISDPDGVVFDAAGTVSGLAGSVIVGSGRKFSRIAPNGAVTILHTNATFPGNPTKMIFEAPGRMLFADALGLGQMTNNTPQLLTNVGPLFAVAVDSLGRVVASTDFNPGRLMLFSPGGNLFNETFAPAKIDSPLARGPGGDFWRHDIIAVSPAGDLVRVDTNGVSTTLGTGFFGAHDFAFGPDGALHVSFFGTDEIVRIEALPLPVAPGLVVEPYAIVPDPQGISFAPDGTLYAGRDNTGSGGLASDAVKIHRVGVCGSPVTEFGNAAARDPDAVIFDVAGIVSGIPGSVIVGGVDSGVSGRLARIAPNGVMTTLFGPSTAVENPTKFAFASPGRLLFTDFNNNSVLVMTNATPQQFVTNLPSPYSLAVDSLGRVLVSSGITNQVRLYSAAGVLLSNVFVTAQPRSPLARGPGGVWGTNVYFVATNGNLRSVSPDGAITEHGTGFGRFPDMEFGPDGALYLSDFTGDCVIRVTPPGHVPAPAHWWRGEGNALDSVAADHGTVTGGVTYAPGPSGQAFSFSNAPNTFSAQITFGTNAGNFGTGDFTVMYWIKTVTNTTLNIQVLAKRATCNHHSFWNMAMGGRAYSELDGDFAGATYLGVGFSTNGPLVADGAWHHVALVRRGTEVLMYADGVPGPLKATNFVVALSNSAPLTVNSGVCQAFGTSPFNGLLDEIKIYHCALDQSQIALSAGLPNPALPRLNIALLPNSAVRLSWTTNAPGFVLQTNGPSFALAAWNALGATPVVMDTNFVVTNAVNSPARNFRLRKP